MEAALEALRSYGLAASLIAPFAGAALVALAPGVRFAWVVACVAAIATAALTLAVSVQHLFGHASTDAAASLQTDGASLFLTPVLAWCAALILIAAIKFQQEAIDRATPLVFALVLATSGGWSLALHARDWVTLLVGVEIGALAAVALAALSSERDRGGLHGALRLFSMGAVASALMLIGTAMIARGAGVDALADLPMAFVRMPALVAAGAVLVILALAMRAALAPLHAWGGALFGRGGDLAVLVVGVIACVGAVSVLLRIASYVLPAPALGETTAFTLAAIGVASVVIGSVQAAGAVSVRRLGFYAGAAQAGCILLAAALGSPAGYSAALILTFGMAVAALAFFAGAAAAPGERPYAMEAIDGLGRRAPLAGAAMAAAALSFMGAPLTIGFLGRWQLMEASVGADWWWAASAGIAASLAGVFFGGRLIERLYFRRIVAVAAPVGAWRFSLGPALVVGIVCVALAVAPEVLLRAAGLAGADLAGVAP
jgi:NADH:ubiquinone oxidoreductase subunit 2 (subunit N)